MYEIDKENEKAVAALKKLEKEGFKTLIILGPVGTGKTKLATEIISHDYIIDEPTFKQHIVAQSAVLIPQGTPKTRVTLRDFPLEALSTFPSVIYDDLGTASMTDAYLEKTLFWINERTKSKNKRTVITTNLTLEEFKSRDLRISSRLLENAQILLMDGKDRRKNETKIIKL